MRRVPAFHALLLLSLPLCMLRAQSTDASPTGQVTDALKATIAESKVVAPRTFHVTAIVFVVDGNDPVRESLELLIRHERVRPETFPQQP